MSQFAQVHLAGDDDLYSGFNEYNPLDSQDVLNDPGFQQAVARTSHGRRPTTGRLGLATSAGGRMASAMGARGRTALGTAGGRPPATSAPTAGGRPMTAVRGAGYTSQSGASSPYDPSRSGSVVVEDKVMDNPEEKYKTLEKKISALIEESAMAFEKGDYNMALEKAKEAGKKETQVESLREKMGAMDSMNIDLTFTVLFNLAHQYSHNPNMHGEALKTYQVLVKHKPFVNSGRLKINIGNLYFKKKEFGKAIKYYRMALDQVPSVQKIIRTKIKNNIGVAFVKLGDYDNAVTAFESCMDEKATYRTGLNLILCAYTLDEKERMKETFTQLLEISPEIDDDDKYMQSSDDPHENVILETIKNDSLRQWERRRKQEAERTILTAARLISPAIAESYSEGYAWCVEQIKQSAYADLASDLEIKKAIQFLKQRDLPAATEVLKAFEKKESKVASAASNNLSFMYFLQKDFEQATSYAEQAILHDRYNPCALVNKGNICFAKGEFDAAREFYREALSNEASCVEALYNLGLASKEMGNLEEALACFAKLHGILRNNVQVMYQLGHINEILEDISTALEWYSNAQNLAPTDPGLLAKLGELYDREGDKSQAFQCHYDSYRYFPSNIHVIEWLGAYYIDAQFSEKAVNYFEKAALIQPNEVKWQLMVASCHRRSGNYQRALETYRQIHRKFPDNVDSLKFLVRIAGDLGLPETEEYASKLKRAEKVHELRQQFWRTWSMEQKRFATASAHNDFVLFRILLDCQRRAGGGSSATIRSATYHSAGSSSAGRSGSSRGSMRAASSGKKITIDGADTYEFSEKKPLGNLDYAEISHTPTDRPMTGMRRKQEPTEEFGDEVIGDDLLPE